jgi:hypothetical protein
MPVFFANLTSTTVLAREAVSAATYCCASDSMQLHSPPLMHSRAQHMKSYPRNVVAAAASLSLLSSSSSHTTLMPLLNYKLLLLQRFFDLLCAQLEG